MRLKEATTLCANEMAESGSQWPNVRLATSDGRSATPDLELLSDFFRLIRSALRVAFGSALREFSTFNLDRLRLLRVQEDKT
jgi:hypothetical protein